MSNEREATKGTDRTRATAEPSTSATADPRAGASEEDDDVGEDPESPSPQFLNGLLVSLVRLNAAAADAYDIVADCADQDDVRNQLTTFRDQHRRHIIELQDLLRAREAELPPLEGEEGSLFRTLAELVEPLGIDYAIDTLIANEHVTNASYQAALEYDWEVEEAVVLHGHFADEQQHFEWLCAQEALGDEGDVPSHPPAP